MLLFYGKLQWTAGYSVDWLVGLLVWLNWWSVRSWCSSLPWWRGGEGRRHHGDGRCRGGGRCGCVVAVVFVVIVVPVMVMAVAALEVVVVMVVVIA